MKNMKNKTKKLIALLCAGACLFSVIGCSGDNDDETSNGGSNDIVKGEKIEVDLYDNPYTIEVTDDGDTTLAQALEGVKALQNDASVTENYDAILIKLSAGRHLIEEPVVIDGETATGNMPIVIKGAADGATILDGGVCVSGGWTEYQDGIYKKQINGVEKFRQLYIDGEVGTRSRYPNDTGNLTSDYLPLTWNENKEEHDTKGCVAIPYWVDGDFSKEAFQEAELHFVQEWTQSVGHIWDKDWVEYDEKFYFGFEEEWFTTQLFTRAYPIRNISGDNKCWLEDSLEFVDVENEWYFDDETSTLYYKPKAGVDINSLTFEIPQTESIIKIWGTPEKQAKGVSLSNLTVANTSWTYPSTTGYIDAQAGLYYGKESGDVFDQKSTSAGIYTLYAHDVIIDNCHIKNMGAYGVDFHVGTKNAMLINSTVENTAGSAVNIGTYGETNLPEGYVTVANLPATEAEITEKITVHNNLIQHIGTSFKGGSTGIVAGFARNLTLEHNTITDVSYSGIALGWGWEKPNTVLCNFIVNNNHITDTMNHLPFDGGPIYLVGKHMESYGSEIKNNYIEASGLGGIYFDNSSSSYIVDNNVIKGEGIQGIIDLHDWNYLLENITVTNTYSNLKYPDKGVHRHHYWHETGYPTDDAPSAEERRVFYDEHIYAYEGGEWSEAAQEIIDHAGIID